MNEIEVKFRVTDRGLLTQRLTEFDASLSHPIRQDDQAYAPSWWSYGESKIGVSFARLRTQTSTHIFTVKKPVTDEQRLGAFFEIEAVVHGDPDGTKEKLRGFAATLAGLGDPVEQTYDSLVRAAG